MRRRSVRLACVVAILAVPAGLHAQYVWFSTIESDGFQNGDRIYGVNNWLGDETGAPDATTEQSRSPTLSAKVWSRPGTLPGGVLGTVDLRPYALDEGAYVWSCWQYVTTSHTGTSYFLMFNRFDAPYNWSCQVQFRDDGQVLADFGGETLPGNYGTWVELKNVIDLDEDRQRFSYDGQLLYEDSWTERISGGGEAVIAAVELFNNDSGPVYYDDLALDVLPREGACCLFDGTCAGDNVTPDACASLGGEYQGHGSTCAASYCPNCDQDCNGFAYCTYEIGETLDPPVRICGDTTGAGDDCAGSFLSGDDQYELIIEEDGVWSFSLCNEQSFSDNALYLYADCDCANLIASDLGSCPGGFSEITATLTAGTYYVVVEGFGFREGPYCLDVSVECQPPPCRREGSFFAVAFGGPVTGDATDLCESDDVRLEVRQLPMVSPLLPHIRLETWVSGCGWSDASRVTYRVEGHVSAVVGGGQRPDTLRTSVRNYATGLFELVDLRATPPNADVIIEHVISENASEYVTEEEVRVRVDVFDPGQVAFPLWSLRLDQYDVAVE